MRVINGFFKIVFFVGVVLIVYGLYKDKQCRQPTINTSLYNIPVNPNTGEVVGPTPSDLYYDMVNN